MHITTIDIFNFRCFDVLKLNLRPNINLLVGDNATGKTTILKACKYAASCFFSGFNDENANWLTPNKNDFQQVILPNGVIAPSQPITIEFSLTGLKLSSNSKHQLTLKNSKSPRPKLSSLKDLRNSTFDLSLNYFNRQGQNDALPLIACFNTEDIHPRRKIDASKLKQIPQKPSVGYYECLEGNGFLPIWEKRLLILQEARENLEEIEIVKRALISALGPNGCDIISDFEIRVQAGKICYRFKDDRVIESENLSDGYRRLINIVMNISFRCALLNRTIYGLESNALTKGLVIIDEIDLHLHPSLQASILPSLSKTFPGIQFIVSTHAPMVMSGIEDNGYNQVLKLDYKNKQYQIHPIKPYGMDLSSISKIEFKVPPRNPETEKMLDHLYDLLDNENFQQLQKELAEAREKYDYRIPELSSIQANLDFELGGE